DMNDDSHGQGVSETPSRLDSKTRLRVLHLEDGVADSELIRSLLESEGFACIVVLAQNQKQFESAIEKGTFDLILSDYSLPSYDGFQALRFAQERQPDAPFILVSGTLGESEGLKSV